MRGEGGRVEEGREVGWRERERERGYLIMYSILLYSAEDVQSIVTGKLALKYAGAQIEAIQSIARASQNRSVAQFEKVWCMWWWGMLYVVVG